MRALLDTHAFLWFVGGNGQPSAQARGVIADPNTDPLLSVASVWEMAIKISLGKLTIPAPFEYFISTQLQRNGMTLLAISVDHAARVVSLPFHHRDPFDRLLVAQALVERQPILSADGAFDAYGVNRVW